MVRSSENPASCHTSHVCVHRINTPSRDKQSQDRQRSIGDDNEKDESEQFAVPTTPRKGNIHIILPTKDRLYDARHHPNTKATEP
jgi:hypothetical protein